MGSVYTWHAARSGKSSPATLARNLKMQMILASPTHRDGAGEPLDPQEVEDHAKTVGLLSREWRDRWPITFKAWAAAQLASPNAVIDPEEFLDAHGDNPRS